MNQIGQHYLEDALRTFREYKKLGERAFAQTSDEDFFRTIDDESNSIAVIVKHIAGNMLSRWTDFLTTDGEKPERNRDMEFVMLPETTKDEMIAFWEKVGKPVREISLNDHDLLRRSDRGEDHQSCRPSNRKNRINATPSVRCLSRKQFNPVSGKAERAEKPVPEFRKVKSPRVAGSVPPTVGF